MVSRKEEETSRLQQHLQSLEVKIRNKGEGLRQDSLKDYRLDDQDSFKHVNLSGQFQFPLNEVSGGNFPNGGNTISHWNQVGNNSQGLSMINGSNY